MPVFSVTNETVTHVTSGSVELREVQGIGTRRAGAAEESVLHDEGLANVVALEELEDVGLRLHVVLAYPASAESARSDGGPAAMPAVHLG
jgi:hypothetical protein